MRPGRDLIVWSWTFHAWQAPHYLARLVLTTSVDCVVARLLASDRFSQGARRTILLARWR